MPRKQRQRAAVELPKGIHRVVSRGREFFYFQAGRGTSAEGPRSAYRMTRISRSSGPRSVPRRARATSRPITPSMALSTDTLLRPPAALAKRRCTIMGGPQHRAQGVGAVADRWRPAIACFGGYEWPRFDAGQGQQFPISHETVVGMGHHARPDLAKPS